MSAKRVDSRHSLREREERIFSSRHKKQHIAYSHQPHAALFVTLLAALLAASPAHTMHVRSCAAEREFAAATASGAQYPTSSAAYTYENTRFRASSSRTTSGMMSASAPAYVSIRQHTSASSHSRIRSHSPAAITERARTHLRQLRSAPCLAASAAAPPQPCQHTSAHVSIRQHTAAYGASRVMRHPLEHRHHSASIRHHSASVRHHASYWLLYIKLDFI